MTHSTRLMPQRPDAMGDFRHSPFTVAWEITRSCPMVCLHCRASAQRRRSPDELTTEEGLALIADAAEMGVQVFIITGGDPLARPDVFTFISAVNDAGMHAGFSPSVTPRLTDAALAKAVDAGAGTIHVSLDGACAETHDAFRGIKGSFARTMRAIEAIAELDSRLHIGSSVSRQTVQDIPLIPPLLEGRVDLWSLFFLVPTGRAKTDDLLSPEEHEEVLRWLAQADLPFAARTIAAPTYRRVRAQLGLPPGPGVNDGRGFAFVSHVGEVCPSGFLQLPVGTVRERPLSYWYREDPLFIALRDPYELKGKCGKCEFREICGGSRARAWAMTGDPLGADPTCLYEPGSRPVATAQG